MKKTVSFSKNATNVFFHILTQCNLKCRHCYINPEQHGRTMLPVSTIESWLSAFAHERGTANVIFLGGEPTLHPDLAGAVRAARRLGYPSVTVDTNGYLFHDILDRVEPDEVDFFSFSLDGATPETNDRIRGEGVFDICTNGIRQAVRRGFATSLIYTVSRENIHELAQMPPLLRELGVRRFFIQVIGIRGNSASSPTPNDAPLQLSKAEWTSVIPKVAEQVAESGVVVSYPKVFLERGETFECAGECAENYFIFPNGRVYRCPLCEDYPVHALEFRGDRLFQRPPINETDLFQLQIPEGCVMNKLIQPGNLSYLPGGAPAYQIACCLLKTEVRPDREA